MSSKITKGEWAGLYVVTGIIDLVQLFGDLFLTEFAGAPEIINEIADPIIGILLLAYFQLRGVSMIKYPKRIFSLLGVTGLEELTGAAAPAWIVDIWYIHKTVKQEDSESQENNLRVGQYALSQQANSIDPSSTNNFNRPLNQGNVRLPDKTRQRPLNIKQGGVSVRPPSV